MALSAEEIEEVAAFLMRSGLCPPDALKADVRLAVTGIDTAVEAVMPTLSVNVPVVFRGATASALIRRVSVLVAVMRKRVGEDLSSARSTLPAASLVNTPSAPEAPK